MKNAKYDIADFPNLRAGFFNQKLKNYTFFFVGENLSKKELEIDLKELGGKSNLKDLTSLFQKNSIISFGLIKQEQLSQIERELEIIQQKIDLKKSHFAALIQYKDPNIKRNQQTLPSEESFMISSEEFVRFYEKDISTGLCYHFMLKALGDKDGLEQIIAHQIGHPNTPTFEDFKQTESAEVIIPHRGDSDDLEVALWYLKKQKVQPQKVSVCFDESVTERHFDMADKNQVVRFFVNFPSGVGPYPSRDVLARTTKEDVILFHDSDDISTFDRTATLINFLNKNNLDAVGSHELRIDKIEKKIVAVRFPINVTDKAKNNGQHSVFFPTTAIKKSAYLKAGGLSTVRKHSSDSQFYKRAYFFLNIKNVDEFLYIRVKRENSLTTGKSTALSSPVRKRLKTQWRTDFLKVKNSNISLLESTLIDEYNNVDVDVIPLSEKHRSAILNWQKLNSQLQEHSLSNQLKNRSFPDAEDILEDRILDFKLTKDPGVDLLKQSFSWRIGWAITRVIILLFGWIPYVRKNM